MEGNQCVVVAMYQGIEGHSIAKAGQSKIKINKNIWTKYEAPIMARDQKVPLRKVLNVDIGIALRSFLAPGQER